MPLPIEITYFNAQPVDDNIQLNWSTSTEINIDYFTIQRSKDIDSFSELLRVQGSRNSNIQRNYTAIDEQPFYGNTYYRLQQTDFDGKNKFSDIIMVHFKKTIPFTIYPNPFRTTISVVIDDISQKKNNCELKIYNVLGEEMINTTLTEPLTTIETGNLSSGMYFYEVFRNFELVKSGRLISK